MKNTVNYIELKLPTIPSSNTVIKRIDGNLIALWGEDNRYPLFLNYLKTKCSLHNGILEGKIRQLYNALPKFEGSENNNNISSNTLNEVLYKLITDFEIKNAFAIKVVKLLNNISYEYVNIDNVRIDKSGDKYYYCENWERSKADNITVFSNYFTSNEPITMAVYMANVSNYFDVAQNKIVYNYYPLPTYVGAIEAILTDIEISHFHLSEISNDFLLGAIVNFANGIPENEDEKRAIINEFRKEVGNRQKRGGILVTFSNGQETAPSVQMLNSNDLDVRYLQLSDDVQERILTAHGVTSPLLFGIKTKGQLGGATELKQAQELFTENYVMPRLSIFTEFVNQVFTNKIQLSFNKCCEHTHDNTDEVIELFNNSGITKDNVKLIGESFEFDVDSDVILSKYQQFSDVRLLTYLQDRVLSLLINGESATTIAKALNIDIKQVYSVMQDLQRMKLLDNEMLPTKNASKSLQNNVLAIFYEYRVRPGLGEPIIDTTRPFCRKLIQLNKLYTRSDIDKISQKMGSDVWYYRGGWYHDPRDGKNYPFCRHYWYQQVGIVDKSLII